MCQGAKGIIIPEKIVCERLVRLVCSRAEKICFISWLFDIILLFCANWKHSQKVTWKWNVCLGSEHHYGAAHKKLNGCYHAS